MGQSNFLISILDVHWLEWMNITYFNSYSLQLVVTQKDRRAKEQDPVVLDWAGGESVKPTKTISRIKKQHSSLSCLWRSTRDYELHFHTWSKSNNKIQCSVFCLIKALKIFCLKSCVCTRARMWSHVERRFILLDYLGKQLKNLQGWGDGLANSSTWYANLNTEVQDSV